MVENRSCTNATALGPKAESDTASLERARSGATGGAGGVAGAHGTGAQGISEIARGAERESNFALAARKGGGCKSDPINAHTRAVDKDAIRCERRRPQSGGRIMGIGRGFTMLVGVA